MGFSGSSHYLAADALRMAVNAAITLEKPLLIKGEPGKRALAEVSAAPYRSICNSRQAGSASGKEQR